MAKDELFVKTLGETAYIERKLKITLKRIQNTIGLSAIKETRFQAAP
jgi:hypothetical protein